MNERKSGGYGGYQAQDIKMNERPTIRYKFESMGSKDNLVSLCISKVNYGLSKLHVSY